MLRVRLFGGLTASWGEIPLPAIASASGRSLFAYLLTYRDRPHTRDLLTGTFWPDLPDDVARRRLSQALWQVRRALAPYPVLLTEGTTVQINPELPLWLDVEEFTRHRVQLMGGGTAEGSETLLHGESCLQQYRGDFLAGYYDDWALAEQERLRELFLAALGRLVVAYKGRGDYQAALAHARRLAGEDPLREEAHREVMSLCHVLGRGVEALRQYDICRRVLADELGAGPSPETEALAAEIAERSGPQEPPWAPVAARPSPAPLLDQPDRLPLVGRQAELAEILKQVEAAAQGAGGLVLVYGEAGVGKTRLLRELARNAQWRGIRTTWGRCYELAGLQAYQPLVEVLRTDLPLLGEAFLEPLWRAELARLLPELATRESPAPLGPEHEQHRLWEAIARGFLALARAAPGLVLLEDAHWIDVGSLAAIRYLLPRLESVPLLIVVTARGEEVAGEQAAAFAALERTRLPRRLELGRLNLAESGELVQHALGLDQAPADFSARLFAETEGNPFFLTETLRSLVDEGLLYRDAEGEWSTPWDESSQGYAEMPLPDSVLQSIEGRLDRLPAPLREPLDLAAVIGRGVPFGLWQQAGDWVAEELLAAGDELRRRGLLLSAEPETAAGADYVFAHDQIRRVTYEGLAGPRRRMYHGRVAEALTRSSGAVGIPALAGALAYHWTAAQVWDKAASCHQQAGDRARAVYANADAVAHYTQALEALDRLPRTGDADDRYQILLAREAVYDLQGQRAAQAEDLQALEASVQAWESAAYLAGQAGQQRPLTPALARRRVEVALRRAQYTMAMADYAAATAMIQEAASLATAAGLRDLEAEGYYQWGMALRFRGEAEQARQKLEVLLEMTRREQLHDLEAKALGLLARVVVDQGRYAETRLRGEQALRLFREHDDRSGESATEWTMGIAATWEGDYVTAKGHFARSLRLAGESGYFWGEGVALGGLGGVAAEEGDFAQAVPLFDRALRIFVQTGDRDREGIALNNLGFVLDQLGAHAEAESHFERYLAICRDVGARQGEGVALFNLAHVSQRQGEHERALQQAQQSLELAEKVGERRIQGYAWTVRGCVLVSLGRLAEAESAFRRALALRRELGQPNVAMESLAGLVRVALARNDLSQACAYADEILEHLATGSLGGSKDPLWVYLSCYQALHAVQDARAEGVLAEAYGRLQEQATRIGDDRLRRSYLEDVDFHREIIAAYQAWQSRQPGGTLSVRLPRAGAPLRRALGDDDYVTVAWTPDAPEDAGCASAADRRRQRLLRLLRQASEQGAAPTVDDLARGLEASVATVKRDLAELRRQGLAVKTRGSPD